MTDTICPGSSDPFYIVTYCIKWGHYFLDIQYIEKIQHLGTWWQEACIAPLLISHFTQMAIGLPMPCVPTFNILVASEITANLYCKCVYLYLQYIFAVKYGTPSTSQMFQFDEISYIILTGQQRISPGKDKELYI